MECGLCCGWMGGCVGLWMCMCTYISTYTCLLSNLTMCLSMVQSVFCFRDCVGLPFGLIATHFFFVLRMGIILPTIHTIVSRGTSSVLQGRIGGSAYSLYIGTIEANSLECPVHCLSPPLHFGHILE